MTSTAAVRRPRALVIGLLTALLLALSIRAHDSFTSGLSAALPSRAAVRPTSTASRNHLASVADVVPAVPAAPAAEATTQPTFPASREARAERGDSPLLSRTTAAAAVSAPASSATQQCQHLQSAHAVVIGTSWGSLPIRQQQRWTKLGCDALLLPPASDTLPKRHRVGPAASASTLAHTQQSGGAATSDTDAWVEEYMRNHHDALAHRPPTQRLPRRSTSNRSLRLAICVATTSRKIRSRKLADFSLFSFSLPSLRDSLAAAALPSGEAIGYAVYAAYDAGDPFYDDEATQREVAGWMESALVRPLAVRGIEMRATMLRFTHSIRKPGPVFNFMMAAAYEDGADYLYRVNDDTQFDAAGWAQAAIIALRSFRPPNVGVVGPMCAEGNTAIMTHDLVHRTHLQIFDTYYPPILSDWWMDDWISSVYGSERTGKGLRLLLDKESASAGVAARGLSATAHSNAQGLWRVHHRVTYHGTRYEVDQSHARMLKVELRSGRDRLESWLSRTGDGMASIEDMPT